MGNEGATLCPSGLRHGAQGTDPVVQPDGFVPQARGCEWHL